MSDGTLTIRNFTKKRNEEKSLFTPGPASLLVENITGLRPCFGRGDRDYLAVEEGVLDHLKKLSGHENISVIQGSASLALEIMALNFLSGKVLLVDSGYYSNRFYFLCRSAQLATGEILSISRTPWSEIDTVRGEFDWIVACYTETSCGLRLPIENLVRAGERLSARLMLDATGSIGLEDGHDKASVIGYSSCKGLFGLTGACFIAFNDYPSAEVPSFYLNLRNHMKRLMTGPYHAVASLADVLPRHQEFFSAVEENKRVFCERFRDYLCKPPELQPYLCTQVSCKLSTVDTGAVLYESRLDSGGSIVCHLGEVHLAADARGRIIDRLKVVA